MRRTILTATALIIGGAMLIFSLILGDGTHEQWIDSGVRTGSGHVTIERPEFILSRKIEDRLPASARPVVMTALESPDIAEQITTVFTRLTVSGLASSAAGARPAQILGVEPVVEAALSPLDDQVVEGRYLEPDDRLAAYVGAGLVESLDLRLGSRLVLTAQDAKKDIAGQLVRVVGVFRSGVPEMDQSLIHIPIATAGEWLGAGHDVTSIGVLVDDSTAVPRLVRHLRQALADPIARGETTVMGWREAMPALRDAVLIDEWGGYLVFVILFVIIGFSIVNTVLMSGPPPPPGVRRTPGARADAASDGCRRAGRGVGPDHRERHRRRGARGLPHVVLYGQRSRSVADQRCDGRYDVLRGGDRSGHLPDVPDGAGRPVARVHRVPRGPLPPCTQRSGRPRSMSPKR